MLRVRELHRILGDMIAAGQGERPVFVRDDLYFDQDGVLHGIPVESCEASGPEDGDVCWLVPE